MFHVPGGFLYDHSFIVKDTSIQLMITFGRQPKMIIIFGEKFLWKATDDIDYFSLYNPIETSSY